MNSSKMNLFSKSVQRGRYDFLQMTQSSAREILARCSVEKTTGRSYWAHRQIYQVHIFTKNYFSRALYLKLLNHKAFLNRK